MPDNRNAKQGLQNRDVNAAQRASLAVKLRAQKVRWEDVARMCGYGNPGTAHRAVMRELERTVSSNVEELRREEAESLDRLELKCWQRLEDKAYEKSMLFAVDRIVAIKERRARLMGLDLKVDDAMNTNMVVVREVPAQYLGLTEVKSE